MAICALNKSLLRSNVCQYTLNDVVAVYLANFSEISAITTGDCDTTGVTEVGQIVTAVTLTSGASWNKIEAARNTGAFSDTLETNDNGGKWRVHSVSFNFNGTYDCTMPDVIDALSLGKFVAIVSLASGDNIMLGRLAGLEAETVTNGGESGAENAAGISVTLSGNQAEAALPVTDDVMTSVKANLND